MVVSAHTRVPGRFVELLIEYSHFRAVEESLLIFWQARHLIRQLLSARLDREIRLRQTYDWFAGRVRVLYAQIACVT